MPQLSALTGAPRWIELFSSDVASARTFYGELFGWTSDEPDPALGGYLNFRRNGERIAGLMHNDGSQGTPDLWSTYLGVSDAKAVADAAVQHGGTVIVPAMDVADLGTMVVVTDPGGAVIGGWQPGSHTGLAAVAETGAPSWFELHTRDFGRSLAFYQDVFGWTTHAVGDTDEFRYSTLGENEAAAAGIMDASSFLPDGVPAHWSVYFGVDSADETLERVVSLGGAVVLGAEDTPYGRLATATDPTGAPFKLIQSPA
jgi:hypothetical protein